MKFLVLFTALISGNALADSIQDCINARTALGFTTGDLTNPAAYTTNDYGSHGENVYSLKCEPQTVRQKFISMTGYAFYESRSFPDLGCGVYDPSTGKVFTDWFTPSFSTQPEPTQLYWCIDRLKEKILSQTQKRFQCYGMRYPCVDHNTDTWKCCHMGNH